MFKYIFLSLLIIVFLNTAFPASQNDEELKENGIEEPINMDSADEMEAEEPSLEEPSAAESDTFDAGAPPVTTESLEEEDTDSESV